MNSFKSCAGILVLTCLQFACGDSGSSSTSGGGGTDTGGNDTGGSPSTGGNPSTGGSPSTGGNPSTGGSPSTGGNGGEPSTGGAGGEPSTGGSGGAGGDPSTGGAGGTGGTGGTGGGSNCIEITLGAFTEDGDGDFAVYLSASTPSQGDAAVADRFGLELYSSAIDPAFNGEDTGTFDLAAGADANYSTCSRCIRVVVDATAPTPGKVFFQSGGSIDIASATSPVEGNIDATLTDVTLVEVTIDPTTYVSTPVVGGECLHITMADFAVAPPMLPANWSCDPDYFNDGLCDCGCAAADVDCADALVGSCDYCDDVGSCSEDAACPGSIDPTNNAICTM